MGTLAFLGSHKVNGVSALHTELMRQTVFGPGYSWCSDWTVPEEVHVAPLPHRFCQHLTDRRLQTRMVVGDNELHASQAALLPASVGGIQGLHKRTVRRSCESPGSV
jgi:Carbohydrate phosphorylase